LTEQAFDLNDIAAIVLAAGRSRRMGAFKPLLPFGNQTVVESCITNLQKAAVAQVIVVVGHRGKDIRQQLEKLDVEFAVNSDPDSEMSASIKCGLEVVSPRVRALLIGPVDHPAIEPDTISQLVHEWRGGASLIQPVYDGHGGHPVLVDFHFRDELCALDPQTGLRSFFAEHRDEVRRLPVSCPYVARDMDTWEDYQRLHEDVFGAPPALVQPLFAPTLKK
jgi:molybdenum cofactor cytidylyltransferase